MKSILFGICLCTFGIGANSCSHVQNSTRAARDAIEIGRYDVALRRLATAEKYGLPSSKQQIDINYLRAKSYEGQGKISEAIRLYQSIDTALPNNAYGYLAREKLRYFAAKASPSEGSISLLESTDQLAVLDPLAVFVKSSNNLRENPIFRIYLSEIRNSIDSWWSYPCVATNAADKCEVRDAHGIVEFSINRDGSLASISISKSSGIAIYDFNVIEAMIFASPFSALPEGVIQDVDLPLRCALRFEYVNNLKEMNRLNP